MGGFEGAESFHEYRDEEEILRLLLYFEEEIKLKF